jgi:hypothetical protein
MAQRGRPKKQLSDNIMTLAEMLEKDVKKQEAKKEKNKELEEVYIELAKLKVLVDDAHTRVSFVDEAESVSAIAFKAGRAYEKLTEALNKLESILDDMYDNNSHFEYYEDIN